MTWFTDSVFEKMMTQKPHSGRRDSSPPASHSPACDSCPYKKKSPCVGYCIKQIKEAEATRKKD